MGSFCNSWKAFLIDFESLTCWIVKPESVLLRFATDVEGWIARLTREGRVDCDDWRVYPYFYV